MKKYCTQNNGHCETCSLVNYGYDCENVKIKTVENKYQFSAGRRKFHITAKNQNEAENKAEQWHEKNARHTILTYDYRID